MARRCSRRSYFRTAGREMFAAVTDVLKQCQFRALGDCIPLEVSYLRKFLSKDATLNRAVAFENSSPDPFEKVPSNYGEMYCVPIRCCLDQVLVVVGQNFEEILGCLNAKCIFRSYSSIPGHPLILRASGYRRCLHSTARGGPRDTTVGLGQLEQRTDCSTYAAVVACANREPAAPYELNT